MSSNDSTREIPISQTLEELLTDVEFEYSDNVTLQESTNNSTSSFTVRDVTNEGFTTIDDSENSIRTVGDPSVTVAEVTNEGIATNDDSENSIRTVGDPVADVTNEGIATNDDPDNSWLPDHQFVRKTIYGKKGKMKGVTRVVFTLIIGPHTFKKIRTRDDITYFYCVDCQRMKKVVSAVATYCPGEDPMDDRYTLEEAPAIDEHCCAQTGTEAVIKVARMEMRKRVQEDPSRPIPQIYEEVRKETFNQFDESGQFAIAADFPPFRSVQSELFKERRCFIPPEPKSVQDLDLESGFLFEGEENIIKGDTIISENKRVVMFSTNALLDVLARGKQILGDGTFKITPSLFHQVFCISSQVDLDGTFVTCAYVLLPDKTKESYNVMFSMLKEALSRRGLELSAEYFMSDFEINIRQSFMKYFPTVMVKGCIFHYAKAIVGKVNKKGFKAEFSDLKNHGAFNAFVRAILGLPYVPLIRLNEGIRNLYILCKKLHNKQRKFGISMIKYVESVWVRGNYPPITWNVANHDGAATNNASEAHNRKLGAKFKPHPNFYSFCGEIKKEMETSKMDALAARASNTNVKSNVKKKALQMKERRNAMKERLENGLVDICSFQQSMGGLMMLNTGGYNNDDDNDDQYFNERGATATDDEPIVVPRLEDIAIPMPQNVNQEESMSTDIETILEHQANVPNARKKTNPVSNVEYRHVTGTRKRLSEMSYSVGGRDLRIKRRCLNNRQADNIVPLNVNPTISVNISPSSTKAEILSFFGLDNGDKLTLNQGELIMVQRLEEIGFISSKNMPKSPRDGSCLIASFKDQIEGQDHVMAGFAPDLKTSRIIMAKTGYNLVKSGRLSFIGDGTIEDWLNSMMKPSTYGDEIMLNAASNLFSSTIVIFSALKESSVENRTMGFYKVHPLQQPMNPPLYLFYFNESDFTDGHYESIFPVDNKVPEFLSNNAANISTADNINEVEEVVVAKKRGRPRGSRNKTSSKSVDNAAHISTLDNMDEEENRYT